MERLQVERVAEAGPRVLARLQPRAFAAEMSAWPTTSA
jgi:hypothetical protein